MKHTYQKPRIEETQMNLANGIAAGCWVYSGSDFEGGECDNLATTGMPILCIDGWPDSPAYSAS